MPLRGERSKPGCDLKLSILGYRRSRKAAQLWASEDNQARTKSSQNIVDQT